MAKKKTAASATMKDDGDSVAPLDAVASAESSPASTYQVLARRYRSRDFGEVIGQDAIARTLQNAIRTGRTAHAYLFCGTRGVGKTSMARIFARALNAVESLSEQDAVANAIMRGEDIDVIEIDAASNRGIDNARDLINGAGLMPARGRYKIYIIDEVHMLTTPAFNALLKTMEEPPSHVKFILCTTEPQSVPATIQSRCQRFDFRNIATTKIADHLRAVVRGEGAGADERVIMHLARMANGSMRDALSLLERLLAAAPPHGDGSVKLEWSLLEDIFGLPDETLFERTIEAIGKGDAQAVLTVGGELLERGLSIERALDLLAERFRWIMLAIVCGKDTPLLEVASETRDQLEHLAPAFDPTGLVHLIALCDSVASKARDSSSPRVLFDAALVRMALSERFAQATAVLAGAAPPGARTPHSRGGDTPEKKADARVADLGTRPAPAARPDPATTAATIARAMPAPAPTTVAVMSNADFWPALLEKARTNPREAALLDNLDFREFDGAALTLAVRDGEAGSGYLTRNVEVIRSTVARLAGRPIEVRVHVDATAAPRAPVQPRGLIRPEIRENPIVKLVSDLFDAVPIEVTPLLRAASSGPLDAPEIAGKDHDV